MREHLAGGVCRGGEMGVQRPSKEMGGPAKRAPGGDEGRGEFPGLGSRARGGPGPRSTDQVVSRHPSDLPSLQMERWGALECTSKLLLG